MVTLWEYEENLSADKYFAAGRNGLLGANLDLEALGIPSQTINKAVYNISGVSNAKEHPL